MKKVIFVLVFVVFSGSGWGMKDYEIIERLARLEQGQKDINKRIDDVNKRINDLNHKIDTQMEQVNKRIDDLNRKIDVQISLVNERIDDLIAWIKVLASVFAVITATMIGVVVWDRRSIVRPFEEKIKEIEEKQGEQVRLSKVFVESLKEMARGNEKLRELLKKSNLL